MKVFILGVPGSCRTTIAKSLSGIENFFYIDALAPAKRLFSDKFPKGSIRNDDYHNLIVDTLKVNRFYIDMVSGVSAAYPNENPIIDGIFSPKDFSYLFDGTKDIVVFLNRLDNSLELRDYENISLSVCRDYCFWLASTNILSRDRWLEFNFRLKDGNDRIRTLGSKNTVYVVGNINVLIEHINIKIKELVGEIS